MPQISKVAVIGAGTMGSGIASHLANAGVPVVLLDVANNCSDGRSAVAEGAIQRLLESAPPQFTHPDNAALITTGNMEDDLELIADCDWVAEAIVERLEIKHDLYRKLETVCGPDTLMSSNTSTIPLAMLTQNMPADRRARFCITHFFNPVRYMRLLEIVAGDHCAPEVVSSLADFCDRRLGKGVVHCADRPGFLGNRVGVYALQVALVEALERGLDVEAVDALMGRPMGIPKTGAFGLYDLIGLDLMLDVVDSLRTALPTEDPFQAVADGIPTVRALVDKGYTGRKGLGGFYREVRNDAGMAISEAVDLETGEFRAAHRAMVEAARRGETDGLKAMLECDDANGRFAWRVLARTLSYAAGLVPEVTEEIDAIDEAMRLGFNWAKGPFEMIDELGVVWFRERLRADNLPVPPLLEGAGEGPLYRREGHAMRQLGLDGEYRAIARPPGVLRLTEYTASRERVDGNEAASMWDLGDGVLCVEFHTKANALHPRSMEVVNAAAGVAAESFNALLIHNAAPHFSVGFNLEFVLAALSTEDWTGIDAALNAFQQSCLALKYAPVPVVSAPGGMALGGGFEVLVQSDALYAHDNTVMGLVETIVGLVPGGGGCKEMLYRWTQACDGDPVAGAVKAFEAIGMAKTASSPREASPLQMFLPRDRGTMSRDRLLPEAKAFALELSDGYQAPSPPAFRAAGAAGLETMQAMLDQLVARGVATTHDQVVAKGLARVLTGGDANAGASLVEQDYLDLEREVFIALTQTKGTRARIDHMLRTGQPLRN